MDAQSTGFENRHGTRRFAQMAVRLTFIARRALCDWHRNPYCCPFWDNHYNVLLQDSRRSAGDKLRSHPLLLLAGKDCGHEDLEQEQNEAEHRHDETVELTTRKHSIVSATLVNNLIAGNIRFCGAPAITLIPNLPQVFRNRTFWFHFPSIVLSIVSSTIVGKMKPKSAVWENLW